MEIVLLVTMIAVAGSALFVAITFKRAMRDTAPLVKNSADDVSKHIDKARDSLTQELQRIAAQLQQESSLVRRDVSSIHERLTYVNGQLSGISGQFAAVLDAVNDAGTQIGTRHEHFSRDLYQQLDDHIARLGGSLSRLGERMEGIERDAKDREAQAAAGIKRAEGSLQSLARCQSMDQVELASIAGKLDRQLEMSSQREDHDLWTAGQMAGTVREIEAILSQQSVIENYLQASLDYEAARTARDRGPRLVIASLCLAGPGADLLWPLLLSFARTVMLRPVARPESPRPAGSRSYLRWDSPDGPPLEEVLRAKLEACATEPAPPEPDLAGLRSLALGLHGTGPGTVRLGPMIINRTPRTLLGSVATAGADPQHGPAPGDPDAWEAALRELAPGRVVDLTSWADGFR